MEIRPRTHGHGHHAIPLLRDKDNPIKNYVILR